MKKLLITAAITLVGVVASAGQANWGAAEIYTYADPDYSYGDGYAVYLINAATYDYEDAVDALAAGSIDFLTADGVKTDVQFVTADGSVAGTTGEIFDTGAVSAYAVILDSATIAGAKHAYLLGSQDSTVGGQGQFASFNWDTNETYEPGAWSAIGAVPEPTSGLLLLIGVAGLALRRRRA